MKAAKVTYSHGSNEVIVRLSDTEAKQLFHDANRLMSLIDEARQMIGEIDGKDADSYRRVHDLLERAQRQLQPGQEGE